MLQDLNFIFSNGSTEEFSDVIRGFDKLYQRLSSMILSKILIVDINESKLDILFDLLSDRRVMFVIVNDDESKQNQARLKGLEVATLEHAISVTKNFTVDEIYIFNLGDKEMFENHPNTNFIYLTHRVDDKVDNNDQSYFIYQNKNKGELNYLGLLSEVINLDVPRQTRNAKTISTFGKSLSYDLGKGFPVITTKKIFFRAVFEELMFFLRGHSNSKLLEEKGISIWKGNTSAEFLSSRNLDYPEGFIGPIYGFNFRHYGAEYKTDKTYTGIDGIDQLKNVIELLRKDPYSRRIIMTSYNPSDVHKAVLYPCHGLTIQFYVNDQDELELSMYQRSADLFLGLPFNISSYSLLLVLVGKIVGRKVGKLHIFLGDCHIYESHIPQVKEQLGRIPYKFPELKINKEVRELDDVLDLKFEDLVLVNYKSHPAIKAEMIA